MALEILTRFFLTPEGSWQLDLLLWLQSVRTPVLTQFMGALTMMGDDLFYVGLLSLMYWSSRRQRAFELMGLVVMSVLLNVVIKNAVGAPRPFEIVSAVEGLWRFTAESASFPSGHAQTAATFWLALAFGGQGLAAGKGAEAATIGQRKVLALRLSACFAVFLIAVSRLYLGVHWPRDVICGGALGAGFGLLGPVLSRRLGGRWSWFPTFVLSVIGIFYFLDLSALKLTFLLVGATLGHHQMAGDLLRSRLEGASTTDWLDAVKRLPQCLWKLFGIFLVGAAYGVTTWLLRGIGFSEAVVSAAATLETGLMVTWVVPALLSWRGETGA